MRHRRHAMMVAALCAALSGCASVVVPSGSAGGVGGAGGADAGPGVCLRHPPARPAFANGGTDERVLAVERFRLGDVGDAIAWSQLGYDLDGIGDGDKTAAGCSLIHAMTAADCGIDNTLGGAMAEMWSAADAGDRIAAGLLPVPVFRLRGLDAQAPVSIASAAIFLSQPLNAPPAWDGNDAFGAETESLHEGDLEKPLLEIEMTYMTDGVWVSGPIPALAVQLPLLPEAVGWDNRSFLLPLRNAIVTMKLTEDGLGATEGTIAGVVLPSELLSAMIVNQIGRTDETEICGHASISDFFHGLVDIDSTGGGTCDAISVGIGFDARAVHLAGVLPPQPPIVPCAGWVG